MAFLGIQNGKEFIFSFDETLNKQVFIELPCGMIEKMIGRKICNKEGPINLSFPNKRHSDSFITINEPEPEKIIEREIVTVHYLKN